MVRDEIQILLVHLREADSAHRQSFNTVHAVTPADIGYLVDVYIAPGFSLQDF